MARPVNDHAIDFKDISITINGLPTSNTNARNSSNNEAKDGFIYTCSTFTDDDGRTYKYNYSLNQNAGDYLDIIKGANSTNPVLNSNYIRSHNNSESIINLHAAQQMNGRTTPTGDFIYNEGYSTATLANGKLDRTGISDSNGGSYTVTAAQDGGPTFYDTQTNAFSNQLTAVRQLAEI